MEMTEFKVKLLWKTKKTPQKYEHIFFLPFFMNELKEVRFSTEDALKRLLYDCTHAAGFWGSVQLAR